MTSPIKRVAIATAAFVGVAGLSACSNVEPVEEVAAQLNPDGAVEIYDVQTRQVLYTTNKRLVEQSDRKEYIAEQKAKGVEYSTLSGDEDSHIWRGVVVNDKGYTSNLYCDTKIKQCDVGGSDATSYRLLDKQVPTQSFDTKGFEPF